MNDDLERDLFRRWPAVFRGHRKPLTESLMGWGCTHSDGWYSILDALCEVLSRHAKELGRQPPEAVQVKEKFGGLRFYCQGPTDEFDHGAITMAEALSVRVCETTGLPGRMSAVHGYYATRSPLAAERDGFTPMNSELERPLPPVPDAGRLLAAKWPEMLAAPIDVPPGWYDIVDVLLACLTHTKTDDDARVVELRQEDERLIVHVDNDHPRLQGIVAFTAAMSTRVSQTTGAAWVP